MVANPDGPPPGDIEAQIRMSSLSFLQSVADRTENCAGWLAVKFIIKSSCVIPTKQYYFKYLTAKTPRAHRYTVR